MRVYYLDRELTKEESEFVNEALELREPLQQIRLPYVLPAPNPNSRYPLESLFDEEIVEKHLIKAGILRDYGMRVCLVIPKDMHWYGAISEAIFKKTGFYPYLIQTRDHRDHIKNPGEIRIIDMHGMMSQ